MLVIGITGTLGAGKGTLVDYLLREKNFQHYSVRQYLIKEIEHRGLEVNRDNMVLVANELRSINSPSYIIEELYKEAHHLGKNSVIESIRTPGEVEYLKKQGDFLLLAVDADPVKRFERIQLRKSSTDQVDFTTFISNEQREFTSSDPNKQNLKKCIEMADVVLTNNNSVDDLSDQFENFLQST